MMAKRTINDCFTHVREILQDQVEPYRYPDSDLIRSLNSALYELKRIRPDVWLGTYGTDLTLYTISDLALEIPFDSVFFQPVVYYIAGSLELRDDEFAIDGRAVTLVRSFTAQVSTPGAA
jgi:hypothetical protein